MAGNTISAKQQLKGHTFTAAQLDTLNPTLLAGEPCISTDKVLAVGAGTWSATKNYILSLITSSDNDRLLINGAMSYTSQLNVTNGTYTALDVTGISVAVFQTGGGNIAVQGLDGGSSRHVIYIYKTNITNSLYLYDNHASGTQKLAMIPSGADQVIATAYKDFWLWSGANWLVND